jgi:hypothetical protein
MRPRLDARLRRAFVGAYPVSGLRTDDHGDVHRLKRRA